MYVSAIVPAAGLGLRLGSYALKPLVKIGSKPMIIFSLQALSEHPAIREIIIVVNPANRSQIAAKIRQYAIKKVSAIVLGGRARQDSVYNGLRATNRAAGLVLIHDAARPFISKKIISLAIAEAKKSSAAIVAVPVKSTIKEVIRTQGHKGTSSYVKKTLDRERLREIQTPQVFKKELLLRAYAKFGKTKVTDEAMLIEKLGRKVSLVMGSYSNIKITTPEDLLLAEAIAKKTRERGVAPCHCEPER